MTPSRIRYILSGLKSEIRRETDRERCENLAVMGLYWNSLLFGEWPAPVEYRICKVCGHKMPLKHFNKVIRNTKEGIMFYRLKTCTGCWNKKRYAYTKKKRESVLK
jgi:hypothetical protein